MRGQAPRPGFRGAFGEGGTTRVACGPREETSKLSTCFVNIIFIKSYFDLAGDRADE